MIMAGDTDEHFGRKMQKKNNCLKIISILIPNIKVLIWEKGLQQPTHIVMPPVSKSEQGNSPIITGIENAVLAYTWFSL